MLPSSLQRPPVPQTPVQMAPTNDPHDLCNLGLLVPSALHRVGCPAGAWYAGSTQYACNKCSGNVRSRMDGAEEKARVEEMPKKPGGQNRMGMRTESVSSWPPKSRGRQAGQFLQLMVTLWVPQTFPSAPTKGLTPAQHHGPSSPPRAGRGRWGKRPRVDGGSGSGKSGLCPCPYCPGGPHLAHLGPSFSAC